QLGDAIANVTGVNSPDLAPAVADPLSEPHALSVAAAHMMATAPLTTFIAGLVFTMEPSSYWLGSG
ncbi:hypothetical protein, partial [Streptomyces sp. C1-2]|uniref:hypothetical protein n=1 Tax=Streptomyces sp. C1-2 TaxID=2720022 RepID=UPI0019CFC9FE